jgi:hypothetical protein
MPNFDKTGPDGNGPKTGKQKGNCKPAEKMGWGVKIKQPKIKK